MKQKVITILPYIMMPVFAPIYVILDKLFFVKIFGCGCVPYTQTNMLHIAFNANDLRRTVFCVFVIIMSFFGGYVSKAFKTINVKVIYCASVILVNTAFAVAICQKFMWA